MSNLANAIISIKLDTKYSIMSNFNILKMSIDWLTFKYLIKEIILYSKCLNLPRSNL